jgi:hypothetical protein
MAAMPFDQRKAARIFGVIAGAAVGIESFFPKAMCCGGTIKAIFFIILHFYHSWNDCVRNAYWKHSRFSDVACGNS